jgi:hypothetical protein
MHITVMHGDLGYYLADDNGMALREQWQFDAVACHANVRETLIAQRDMALADAEQLAAALESCAEALAAASPATLGDARAALAAHRELAP